MEALNCMDYPSKNRTCNCSVKDVAERNDHAELINGVLVVTNQTSVSHNNAVLEIATALRQFISSNKGKCKVFTENVALYCNELCDDEKNLFLPDVMTVCDETGIKDDGIHVAPLFVAEITSDSTKKNDYGYMLEIKGVDASFGQNAIIVGDTANKLGQLEDIEEELGIDLAILFKALKNGAWYIHRTEKRKYWSLKAKTSYRFCKEFRRFKRFVSFSVYL